MTKAKSSAVVAMPGTVVFASATGVVRNRNDECLIVSSEGYVLVLDELGNSERHVLPYGAILKVETGDVVSKGDIIATWCPNTTPVIAETSGFVCHIGFEDGVSVARQVDETSGVTMLVVLGKKGSKQKPRKNVRLAVDPDQDSERWGQVTRTLPVSTQVFAADDAYVERGDIIARIPNA